MRKLLRGVNKIRRSTSRRRRRSTGRRRSRSTVRRRRRSTGRRRRRRLTARPKKKLKGGAEAEEEEENDSDEMDSDGGPGEAQPGPQHLSEAEAAVQAQEERMRELFINRFEDNPQGIKLEEMRTMLTSMHMGELRSIISAAGIDSEEVNAAIRGVVLEHRERLSELQRIATSTGSAAALASAASFASCPLEPAVKRAVTELIISAIETKRAELEQAGAGAAAGAPRLRPVYLNLDHQ